MTRSPITLLATGAVVPLIVLTLASCGGGSNHATASNSAPQTADGRPATLGVANSGLGKILVDSRSRTLYLFKADAGTKSACFGACADAWPPLRTDAEAAVGDGASASALGTTPRPDGKPQVTYNGHPLYLYEDDPAPGDTNGHGITTFGGAWFALSPEGDQVTGQASIPGDERSSYGDGY